jgi:DNA-binding MarR family transcriptional regulator
MLVKRGDDMAEQEQAKQLRELVRLMIRRLGILEEGEMACCGVSLAQCHALVEIGRAGTISLVDLASVLDLDNSTMSRTVNNLVDHGLAERELDPKDRRYVAIRLTQAGMTSFGAVESSMDDYFLQIFRAIPADRQEQVLASLRLLFRAISESACCAPAEPDRPKSGARANPDVT